MKSEWTKVSLLSVCSRLSSGKSISSKLLKEKGVIPVYGGNGVRGYIEEGENFNGECAIIGRQGAYCGNVRFFSGKAYMTEHAIVAQANACADTRFLAYKLYLMQLGRLSGQSAQPGLSVKVLGEQVIDIPPLPIQRKIASILSALDDKIETNNAICRNLEEQVMAIHHYFIITKLCETKKLEQLVEFSKIKRHKSTLELENYFSTENMLPDKAGATAAASLPCVNFVTGCRKGDILISNIRPYFKKIVYCTTEGGCSSDVLCFHPRENTYSAWLYSSLYSDDFFNYVMQGSKGTKMPRGDKSHIMKYGVYVLSEKDLLQFNELAVPMLSLISQLGCENQKINKLRDCLLPKLMNGEIDLDKLGKIA